MIFSFRKTEEQKKLERLYKEYRQLLYAVAFGILKNSRDAEDAVHQTFVKIFDHLEKINENECHKTKAFLVTIMRHQSYDILRARKKEAHVSYEDWEETVGESSEEIPEESDLAEALHRLPVNYSTVLLLKYSHGYDDHEIAKLLDISEENVRQRISRAKKKLAELLRKEGEE